MNKTENKNPEPRKLRKERVGKVISNKGDKTIVVHVDRRFKHSVYGKFIHKTTKLTAHDKDNECKEGDLVTIMETRPLSKTKRWRLTKILKQSK